MNSQLARVMRAEREHYTLLHNGIEIPAVLSGKFRIDSSDFPAVGDWVALRPGTNVIEEIAPRRSVFRRKQAGSVVEAQVMAANIDLVFIVTGLDHDFNLRRMERCVLMVKECGALPVLVLNKADVCPDIGAILAQVRSVACGEPVVVISALTGDSLDALTACVTRGETAALIGSSGVGKTTIVNRLLGDESRATQAVREDDSRGRHTTTHRELILMPQGWWLMDMPGIRELQLWAGPESLQPAFPEIAGLSAYCRFRDCKHEAEPGCAVRGAVDEQRLASYHKLGRELAHLNRQTDIQAAQETKRQWKVIHKAMRHNPKHSR